MKRFENPLVEVREHYKCDRFIQGTYLQDDHDPDPQNMYRGCMFGCIMQAGPESIRRFCELYDMPPWMGFLCENIFEGLNPTEATCFPLQVMEKLVELPEDFDLEKVKHNLAIKRLGNLISDDFSGGVNKVLRDTIALHERALVGVVEKHEWDEVIEISLLIAGKEVAQSLAMDSMKYSISAAAAVAAASAKSAAGAISAGVMMREYETFTANSIMKVGWGTWGNERDWLLEELTV